MKDRMLTMLLSLQLAVDAGTTETTARQFLERLYARQFAEAREQLGAKAHAALSVAALQEAWESSTQPLGEKRSVTVVQTATKNGLEVTIFSLNHATGALHALVTIDPLSSKVEGFFLKPAPAAATTASYVDPAKFESHRVRVGTPPYELEGTLLLPKGAKAPVPAVVFVHGSGPNDRDSTIGSIRPFKDLAEGLASRGIASLRYEKRTFVYGKQLGDVTMDQEVIDDALSAIERLRTTEGVDPKRIVVVGHSLGALLAPEIANRSTHAAGVVLLAPPTRKPWDAIVEQMTYLGASEADLKDTKAAFAQLQKGTLKTPFMGASPAYWKEWASKDGVAQAKKFTGPVLVLWGDRDYQVVQREFDAWREGLKTKATAQLFTIAGANHLFMLGEGPSKPDEYQQPGHVAPVVIERIAAFIDARH